MTEDHDRRISALERSRDEQWEKINSMYAMVKVLYDRGERAVAPPCEIHRADISDLDKRLREIENTGNRFGGAWDFAKVGLGALLTTIAWVITQQLK